MTFDIKDFREKINVHALTGLDGKPLSTVTFISPLPGTGQLHTVVDFFNVKADGEYTLLLYLVGPNGYSDNVMIANITMPKEVLSQTYQDYGKTSVSFPFDINVLTQGDYRLDYIFQDNQGNQLDKKSIYLYFGE